MEISEIRNKAIIESTKPKVYMKKLTALTKCCQH